MKKRVQNQQYRQKSFTYGFGNMTFSLLSVGQLLTPLISHIAVLFRKINEKTEELTNIKETPSNMFSTNSLLKEQLCGKLANFWDKHIFHLASLPMYPGVLTEKQDCSGHLELKGEQTLTFKKPLETHSKRFKVQFNSTS